MWEPLKRSLGKKRREISRDQIDLITEVYAAFAPGSKTLYSEKRKSDCKIECRIFDREEFIKKRRAEARLRISGSLVLSDIVFQITQTRFVVVNKRLRVFCIRKADNIAALGLVCVFDLLFISIFS